MAFQSTPFGLYQYGMQLYYLYCCPTCSTCSKYLEAGGSYLILNKRVMRRYGENKDKLYDIYSGKKAHKTKRTIAYTMTAMCIKLYHRKRKGTSQANVF